MGPQAIDWSWSAGSTILEMDVVAWGVMSTWAITAHFLSVGPSNSTVNRFLRTDQLIRSLRVHNEVGREVGRDVGFMVWRA